MKRILLLTALFVVANSQVNASTVKKPVTTTKPVEVKVQEVKLETKVEEPVIKTEKGKVLSQISGIVVFESDIFRSKNKPKKDTVIGDIDTANEDSTDKEENYEEKMPKGTIELGAKVFENYDVRLKLNSTKSTAEDTSTFSVSRTWPDTYLEWKANINLNGNTLYSSLVPNSEFIVRKSKGRVEGQVKAKVETGVVDKLTGETNNNYGVDVESSETYIKIKSSPDSIVTLRPYDMDWKIGKRFENENFDRGFILGEIENIGGVDVLLLENAFENTTATAGNDQRTPISGIEYEKFMGNKRLFTKLNMFNLTDCLFTQVGADFKVSENSKFTVATVLGLGVNNFGVENETDVSEDIENNYFGLNANGEFKTATTLFEVEGDLRNYARTNKTISDDYSINNFMLGLYGKATFNRQGEMRPFVYSEFVRKSVNEENTNYEFTKAYNSFDLGGGVEKYIDGLKLVGDIKLNIAKEEDYEEKVGAVTTKGGKVDYGSNLVASFKAEYRF